MGRKVLDRDEVCAEHGGGVTRLFALVSCDGDTEKAARQAPPFLWPYDPGCGRNCTVATCGLTFGRNVQWSRFVPFGSTATAIFFCGSESRGRGGIQVPPSPLRVQSAGAGGVPGGARSARPRPRSRSIRVREGPRGLPGGSWHVLAPGTPELRARCDTVPLGGSRASGGS